MASEWEPGEYVLVADLPVPVQSALESVGYGRKDVEVRTVTTVTLSTAGGDGYQGFATLVNLESGESMTTRGSWGGANMFNPNNAVDLDDSPQTLPPNGVAIRGSRGGGRPVSATLFIPASMTARILPASASEPLDPIWKTALGIFRGYKASYRKQELDRKGIGSDVVDALVEAGFLSRNRAGATSLTLSGKNAAR